MSEFALVSSITAIAPSSNGIPFYPHTQIQLAAPLANCYDRTMTTVNANVALATQGLSVTEFLGSGNASLSDQSFKLKQSPLTYVQAPTPTGRQSSLQEQVNGAAWTELPSLYAAGASSTVFATLDQPNGTAKISLATAWRAAFSPQDKTTSWQTTGPAWGRLGT